MAIVRAVKSGNWSDTTVWNTGALPTSADDVYSNTFTVTIDISPTVLSISNASATGVTAGGSFQITANGITLTANINAGNTASITCLAINVSAGNTVNIVGNCNAGTNTSAVAVANASTGTLNITGNCFAGQGAGANGANNNAGGSINLTGSATGGNVTNNYGIANNASGTITITGSCIGSSTANAGPGAYNASTGVLNHAGVVQSGNTAPGIINASTGAAILTGPFLTNANGWPPVSGRWFWQNTTPPATYYQIRSANLAVIRPLYTADSVGGNPATSNVRSGTVYGPNNELTGTCAVPPAGSVALGVPVGNTTGTAAIDGASIRSALGLASANLDAQLDALPTAAEIWSAETRTITGGTVDTLTNSPDVPTEAEIASAVRTELATELDRIDTAISSRLAPGDTLARVTLADTVTTLTNAPDVPTEAEIADAVRTELTPELARVANCATTQEVGDIVEESISSV